MKRLELTEHTVRCPLDDCTASLTVRTDPDGYPSRRHLGVVTCSLLTSPPFAAPAKRGYFADLAPPVGYVREPAAAPCHAEKIACAGHCLAVLNAAEPGAAQMTPSSGIGDAMELARRTQSGRILRWLWLHGA